MYLMLSHVYIYTYKLSCIKESLAASRAYLERLKYKSAIYTSCGARARSLERAFARAINMNYPINQSQAQRGGAFLISRAPAIFFFFSYPANNPAEQTRSCYLSRWCVYICAYTTEGYTKITLLTVCEFSGFSRPRGQSHPIISVMDSQAISFDESD